MASSNVGDTSIKKNAPSVYAVTPLIRFDGAPMQKSSWSFRELPTWFSDGIGSLRYFPNYLKAAARQWISILFGESLLAVGFLIWWSFGAPPLSVIFVSVALVAGYFVWSSEYVKSIPQFQISEFVLQPTPMMNNSSVQGHRIYVQLCPKCMTEKSISGCKAHLICAFRKNAKSEWVKTGFNEVTLLRWSGSDELEMSLEANAEKRINICYSDSASTWVAPDVEFFPARARADFHIPGELSFDIKVTAAELPPIYVSLEVAFRSREWNKLDCKLWRGLTMDPLREELKQRSEVGASDGVQS